MFVHVFHCHRRHAWNWVCLEKSTFNLVVSDSTPCLKTEICHSFLSLAWWVQFSPIAFILSDHFQWSPFRFPDQILYAFLFSSMCVACCAIMTLLTICGKGYKWWSFSYATFSAILLLPLSSTLFLHALNLLSSLTLSDHISQPQNTTNNIVSLHILSPKSLNSNWEDSKLNGSRHTENWISV